MKRLKTITGIALMAIFGFTSCQSEVDVQGENQIQMLLIQQLQITKRTSMYDGSFDDFIDGASSSIVVLPAIAKVNGSQVTF
jgi:hypothetical protein